MPSKPVDRNIPFDVDKAVKQRILRAALLDKKSIDSRSAYLLRRHDILKNLRREPIQKDIKAIIASPSHRDRLPTEWGPLVFVKEKDRLVIIEAIHLLFDSNVAMRRSVLRHLESGVDRLAPDTVAILRKSRKALTSSGDWLPVAVQLYDAISCDFRYNLQGFRQSLSQRYGEGVDSFAKLLICPSPQSIGGVRPPVWNATQQASEVEEGIRAIVERNASLVEAIEQYYQRYGFLPLAPALSIAQVVTTWLTQRGASDNIWSDVWKWADDDVQPLKRYHAVLAFLMHPQLVPDACACELWKKLASIMSTGGEKDEHELSDIRLPLMCKLAQHYCQYFASNLLGGDGEVIASFAWWVSRELVAAIPAESLSYVAEKILPRMMFASWSEHRFLHPSTKGSSLQYGTIFFESIWAMSIVCHLAGCTSSLGRETLSDADRIAITAELEGVLVAGFPLAAAGSRETYAFDTEVLPSAASWITSIGVQEEIDRFNVLVRLDNRHVKQADLLDSTDNFSQYLHPAQVLLARLLHIAGYSEDLSPDDLWQRLLEPTWRKNVLEEGCVEAVCIICDTLIDVLTKANPEWAVQLPHFFAAALEVCALDNTQRERCECLLIFALVACVCTQTVSAAERLVQTCVGNEPLRQALQRIRAHLKWLLDVAQPASAGRIRPVLLAINGI
jgi:hypothetical protein